MFGGFGKKGDDAPKPSSSTEQTDVLKKSGKSQVNSMGFDPDSLERAAKAARELDSSKNAQGEFSMLIILLYCTIYDMLFLC